MKKISHVLFASLGAMALSACGSADDASVDAEADTVEMPAETALEGVTEEPVEDADVSAEEAPSGPDKAETNAAADAAEGVVEAAELAANAADAAGDAVDAAEEAVD